MAAPTRWMTAGELLRLPDDGYRYELVRGELRKMSPSGHDHGRIVANITLSLAKHVKARRLGTVYGAETGFELPSNPDLVRAPDVAFVTAERAARAASTEGFFPGAPDLAVEVLSPSDSAAAVEEKVADWLAGGTRMVVIASPRQRSLTVHLSRDRIVVLTGDETLDGLDVVPGWTLPLSEAFGD